ncbi:MAG: DUF2163 domain-containing protein [Proteobacteria bacterium]|nr:DUF2163 domain-containing protein [Pseudomonadota bacterium]
MRTVPAELAARLAGGVTTFAHVWRFTRRDGVQFAFTDHDEALVFDALTCEPVSGLVAGAVEKSLGLSVDTASVSGALNGEAISEDDLARGLWDGARVDLYRADWSDPSLRVHLFAGRVGDVRRGVAAFEAELRGLQAPLNVAVGRVFSRFCDADLGDARCGKDIEATAFRGDGLVTEVLSPTACKVSGLSAFSDGWFDRGKLVWSAGGQNEVSAHRVEVGAAAIELRDDAGPALTVGAAFRVYAGCDKSFATCRVKFANTLNFRGFPHMPGDDAIQSRPVTGEIMDGGSRFHD